MSFLRFIFLGALFVGGLSNAYGHIVVKDHTKQFNQGFHELKYKGITQARNYILNYELVQDPQVCSIFFDGNPIPKDPRVETTLQSYSKQLAQYVQAYEHKVPEIKAIALEVEQRTQKLFGMEINADILLSTSVSETDAVTMGSNETQPVVALNMREMSKYSKDELRIVIAHELFHVLQHQIEMDYSAIDMIAANIYSEGWATYASSLVYPGFSDWKYISYFNHNNQQFQRFESDKKTIIKHLLRDWNSKNERQYNKYFSADARSSTPFEPRSGYYIGYLAAKKMAEHRSPVTVALLKYDDFKREIKPILKEMAKTEI